MRASNSTLSRELYQHSIRDCDDSPKRRTMPATLYPCHSSYLTPSLVVVPVEHSHQHGLDTELHECFREH